jgi:hypothetical protein
LVCGSFACPDDNRQYTVTNIHSLSDKKNISLGFDPATIECLSCEERHPVVRDNGAYPCCFILSDQCFPPTMPAAAGFNCMTVLRVEDGRLDELADIFGYYFSKHLKPGAGGLAHGSIILIGSLAQLADLGTELYAQELVRTVSDLAGKLGVGVSILPYIPVPIAGIQSAELIARLADLDSWILTTTSQPNIALPDSRNNLWAVLNQATLLEKLPTTSTGSKHMEMPHSIRNSRRGTFATGGVEKLPKWIPPLTQTQEKLIVGQLILDLNKFSIWT